MTANRFRMYGSRSTWQRLFILSTYIAVTAGGLVAMAMWLAIQVWHCEG